MDMKTEHFEQYLIAPVNYFRLQAPLADCWLDLFNTDPPIYGEIDVSTQASGKRFWFVSVEGTLGYHLKIRYLATEMPFKQCYIGIDQLRPPNHNRNLQNVHLPPIGMPNIDSLPLLATNYRQLESAPIAHFKAQLAERNLYVNKLVTYELVNWDCTNIFVQGRVTSSYADWHCVQYLHNEQSFIWSHPSTGQFRSPGWCCLAGVELSMAAKPKWPAKQRPQEPIDRSLFVNAIQLFPTMELPFEGTNRFQIGMRLETVDPFLYRFHQAMVRKLLQHGYLMIQVRAKAGWTFEYCVHCTSHLLYPTGFCEAHKIPIINLDDKQDFVRAPAASFVKHSSRKNRFKEDMLLETFNLFGPGILSLGFIIRVVQRLLCIGMITSDPEICSRTKWIDFESPHLYPLGMSSLVPIPDSVTDKLLLLNSAKLDFQVEQYRLLMSTEIYEISSTDSDESDEEELEIVDSLPSAADCAADEEDEVEKEEEEEEEEVDENDDADSAATKASSSIEEYADSNEEGEEDEEEDEVEVEKDDAISIDQLLRLDKEQLICLSPESLEIGKILQNFQDCYSNDPRNMLTTTFDQIVCSPDFHSNLNRSDEFNGDSLPSIPPLSPSTSPSPPPYSSSTTSPKLQNASDVPEPERFEEVGSVATDEKTTMSIDPENQIK